jgi:hypothetical protein
MLDALGPPCLSASVSVEPMKLPSEFASSPSAATIWPLTAAVVVARCSCVLLVVVVLAGCINQEAETVSIRGSVKRDAAVASPVTKEAFEGAKFLVSLKKKGHLPGFVQNEHGTATFDVIREGSVEDLKEVTYPFSRTYQLVKNGSTYTNNYTIVREWKDSPWRLEKAWRTDPKGRTIEEWPVP